MRRSAQYWLMKSEPDVFSIQDLRRDGKTFWEGVRNYQARNHMWHDMQIGDLVLFYHSNANPSGVAGLAQVASQPRPDRSAFDRKSTYFDAKSSIEKPRWYAVEVSFLAEAPNFVSLNTIKQERSLKQMVLLNNSRLSVQPVREKEFVTICRLAQLSLDDEEVNNMQRVSKL